MTRQLLLILCLSIFIFKGYTQQISIIGSATPANDWVTDFNMQQDTQNADLWTLTLQLSTGELKFRQDANWAVNWGGNSFPSGTGVFQSPYNLSIPLSGIYQISFDTSTLAYNFILVGSPGGSVSISDAGAIPDNHAILDVQSNSKGMLIPRLDESVRDIISASPTIPTGLLIFNTTSNTFNYWDGTEWKDMGQGQSVWSSNGNDIYYNSGNVGIGTSNPVKPLEIASPGGIRISRTDSLSSDNEIFFGDYGQIRSSDDFHRIIFDRGNNIFEVREFGHIHFSSGSNTGQRTSKVVITAGGRVGIDNTNPTEKLDVNGKVKIRNLDTVATGSLNVVSKPDGTLAIRKYKVGDFAQGGIVFWVDESGEHGLVCAKEDQSTGIRWYAGTYGNTQAKGDGPYSGEMNTAIIIASQVAIGDDGNPYAARICAELEITEGGYTYGDWYLPSKEELNLMYQNRAVINATAIANGGSAFDSSWYWSSSEYSASFAWRQDLSNGDQFSNDKDDNARVRAVRAF